MQEIDFKYPIILPNKDLLVELLILHVHQKNHHSPQDTTIAILRERYHILHIREEVRRVCKRCVLCRHAKTKPLQQKMGILPEERVCPAFAFSDVGVDFTGPIYLKGYDCKIMRKAYICIFTCSRKIISDNQLTFKKANQILKFSTRESVIADNSIQSYLTENDIIWEFITERSPHRGAF